MYFHFQFKDLSFCDDHFKNPDSWEVYSLKDIYKYRHVITLMEVDESLLLPVMSEESSLIGEDHLRQVRKREREGVERERGREGQVRKRDREGVREVEGGREKIIILHFPLSLFSWSYTYHHKP